MNQQNQPPNIMVIDDDYGVRESLKMTLKDKYLVFATANPDEAINYLKDLNPAMIFLDIKMPKINGLDFLKDLKNTNAAIPVVMITAYPSTQSAITALRQGAFDYLMKPFLLPDIHAVVERALNYRKESSKTESLIHDLRKNIQKNFFSITQTLLLTIDAKDSYTAAHSKESAALFALVAKELGMSESQVKILEQGALLHDIGKIGICDTVLMKPGTFSDEEFNLIKRHPEIGYKILEPVNFLKEALSIVHHHHEWYNGEGYPDGLKGTEIPFETAIFSIIDNYKE
ncbi:MAG: response regulator [Candidatus Brocadiaceae baterium WH-1]|nr:MAG: response regulator [Candidatus Jettenia sp. AMX2]